ncbi:hypothetical protein PR048_022829 [Dryococelus australis]|uniref:Uncharacterized protein n=1 Tax=Dryococelus australis TaxID=614101 RepID=A0ABQ9GSC8_9NEOP|nr:hypothetical protein PR048_022829 [Dryococelus australis]
MEEWGVAHGSPAGIIYALLLDSSPLGEMQAHDLSGAEGSRIQSVRGSRTSSKILATTGHYSELQDVCSRVSSRELPIDGHGIEDSAGRHVVRGLIGKHFDLQKISARPELAMAVAGKITMMNSLNKDRPTRGVRSCGGKGVGNITSPPRGSNETDLLTNTQCDKLTENLPHRRHRGANPRPSDYMSATLPLSYGALIGQQRSSLLLGPAVVERLDCLTSDQGETGSIPGRVTPPPPDSGHWELRRAMPLVVGFSRRSPVFPALAFRSCSIINSFHPHRLSRPRTHDKCGVCRAALNTSTTWNSVPRRLPGTSPVHDEALSCMHCCPYSGHFENLMGIAFLAVRAAVVKRQQSWRQRGEISRSCPSSHCGEVSRPPSQSTKTTPLHTPDNNLDVKETLASGTRRAGENKKRERQAKGCVPVAASKKRIISLESVFSLSEGPPHPGLPPLRDRQNSTNYKDIIFSSPSAWSTLTNKYTQQDENTTRQFRALCLEAKAHLMSVTVSSLKLTRFSASDVNRIRLERASQKHSSDTHETPYDRVKRCRERKIDIKASERVNKCLNIVTRVRVEDVCTDPEMDACSQNRWHKSWSWRGSPASNSSNNINSRSEK